MPDARIESASELQALLESSDDAIITIDRAGHVVRWNAGAEHIFGYLERDVINAPIHVTIPDERLAEHDHIVARALAGETVRHVETVRQRTNGSRVAVSLSATPVRSQTGEVDGVLLLLRDLTDRVRAERSARRLAAIVTSSDDAIVSKDLNGTVTSWNRAAERLFGYTATEMIGESIRRLIPADRQAEEDHVLSMIRRGERVANFETIRQRKDRSLVPISLTVSPILDADGTVIGASKIAHDISDRKRSEEVTQQLNAIGTIVASTLDRQSIVQAVTDAATTGTRAQFGAFFYNNVDPESGENYLLYTLSGAPAEAFADFPHPRATALFGPTFRGEGVVRLDDVTKDPRYGQNAPYHGMPPNHLPVRSYLAAPVRSRSGEVLGGLFFGHSSVGKFTTHDERLVLGIANWASVALENARLYVSVQEASRMKDEFLATLSHELRTPLNVILGYARMLKSGLVADEHEPRTVAAIERNATSLTQIVEDLLDVSRIISGKLRLDLQELDLAKVVRDAIEGPLAAAEAKGVRVETVLDPRAGPVAGDPERIQQIVWNLMSNAVKFTPRGGRVQVRLARVNSQVEISVSDTGIGIAPDFLPYVFDRFRQADSGSTRERGGLGLGLAIARHLVELHGGSIQATSGGPGEGATFHVRLPLMIVHPGPHANPRVHPVAAAQTARIDVPALAGIHVLAVDDDRDALKMVAEILEVTGARVSTADCAADVLTSIEALCPDVLIADVGMPRMDGIELIGRIRAIPSPIRDVPAAALTAFARSEDRSKALRAGFQMHLAKPIDPGELMAAVAALTQHIPRPTNGGIVSPSKAPEPKKL